ncbi:zinc ABC transporter substrate-binding protein [Spirulina subsalsa CS-330]|uniref:metal ABC transporter solute-binding protein, Zn/Mn family n=1 Tax=Spirulina sp. TaxID=1157 RepID=UPI003F6F4649|nr:zinc ABC transporter substrate-binding protein [Spirulina subsalsa CS-330]
MKRIMKWSLSRCSWAAAIALLWGCSPAVTVDSSLPQVVTTSTILADLTAEVGGDEIELISILQPGDDPHIYEPVPRDTVALEEADLILYNGYQLEPALIRLIEGVGTQVPRFAVGEVVEPLALNDEGQRVPDPHVWGDAENAIAMVAAIRDQLIALSPDDADLFTANADRLTAELQDLDAWITAQIASIPPAQRQLVTTHDAFAYYVAAYDLTMLGTLIGISTEEQPSAQTVKALSDAIRAAGVPAIFAETTINDSLIQAVATEAQVTLADQPLYSDSLGAPGSNGDSYIKMLVANTEAIATALGGRVEPWPGGE